MEQGFNPLNIDHLRAVGNLPHWFGLGFVQLNLDPLHRMNFWHPEAGPDLPEEELHDHRYDFTSRLLVGEMTHEVWGWQPDALGDFEMFEVSCKPGAPMEPTAGERGRAVLSGRYHLSQGSEYWFPHTHFHRTQARHTVTYLTRGPVAKENARVLHPVGMATLCPFSRPKSEAECWEMIASLLPKLA